VDERADARLEFCDLMQRPQFDELAAQAGPFGIRVNCITPETILTEGNRQRIPADVQASLADAHPRKRLGTPRDVAAAAAFLASDEAAWITGTVVDVAGGAVLV
jgi:3-oxoacyl-[acyl-carrier protein] reductase